MKIECKISRNIWEILIKLRNFCENVKKIERKFWAELWVKCKKKQKTIEFMFQMLSEYLMKILRNFVINLKTSQ